MTDLVTGGVRPSAPHPAVPAVSLRGLVKRFDDVTAVAGVDLDIADGEFFSMLGPSGSGKTTVLRMIGGFEKPTDGHRRARRHGRHDPRALRAQRQHGVPGLRALPAHVGPGQRRLRAAGPRDGQRRAPGAGRRGAAQVALHGLERAHDRRSSRAASGNALRWPAPWSSTRGPAARRAARRPGPQAARADAGRAQGDPARRGHHLRLRHPRPGGGADHERPHRGLQRGPHPAGRHAQRDLRAPRRRVRGPVRRHLQRPRGDRRAAAARADRRCSPSAPRSSRSCAGPARTFGDGPVAADGVVAEVVYAGPVTRYVVDLDGGGRVIALDRTAPAPSDVAELADRGTPRLADGTWSSPIRPPRRCPTPCPPPDEEPDIGSHDRTRGPRAPRSPRWPPLALAALGAAVRQHAVGRCPGRTASPPPKLSHCTELGSRRGQRHILAWPGYAEDGSNDPKVDWVMPFEKQTGCKVTVKTSAPPTRPCS